LGIGWSFPGFCRPYPDQVRALDPLCHATFLDLFYFTLYKGRETLHLAMSVYRVKIWG